MVMAQVVDRLIWKLKGVGSTHPMPHYPWEKALEAVAYDSRYLYLIDIFMDESKIIIEFFEPFTL